MKHLNEYITEKLNIEDVVFHKPKDKKELESLIDKLIKQRGLDADLNDIDTSEITDMSELFYKSEFNGDISRWDVSNVEDMKDMFKGCPLKNHPPKWYKK